MSIHSIRKHGDTRLVCDNTRTWLSAEQICKDLRRTEQIWGELSRSERIQEILLAVHLKAQPSRLCWDNRWRLITGWILRHYSQSHQIIHSHQLRLHWRQDRLRLSPPAWGSCRTYQKFPSWEDWRAGFDEYAVRRLGPSISTKCWLHRKIDIPQVPRPPLWAGLTQYQANSPVSLINLTDKDGGEESNTSHLVFIRDFNSLWPLWFSSLRSAALVGPTYLCIQIHCQHKSGASDWKIQITAKSW